VNLRAYSSQHGGHGFVVLFTWGTCTQELGPPTPEKLYQPQSRAIRDPSSGAGRTNPIYPVSWGICWNLLQ